MRDSLARQIDHYVKSRHQNKHRKQILRCLALLVAFATIYALIVPAVTWSNKTVCGMEAHTHDESCWSVELVDPRRRLSAGWENPGKS